MENHRLQFGLIAKFMVGIFSPIYRGNFKMRIMQLQIIWDIRERAICSLYEEQRF